MCIILLLCPYLLCCVTSLLLCAYLAFPQHLCVGVYGERVREHTHVEQLFEEIWIDLCLLERD